MLAKPKDSGWLCEVVVRHQGERTRHAVTVSPASVARWGEGIAAGREGVESLVRRSFEFLLEREPPRSILRQFDLSVIQTYFPDFDEIIRGSRG